MNTIEITAKKDFMQHISAAPAIRALSELIWNGFDAGADCVTVTTVTNDLGGLEELRIEDNGSGIYQGHVQDLFGNLGDSWKRSQSKLYGRFLHGRNGRGRFKGFAIGHHVEWRSCYEHEGQRYRYTIAGDADSLISMNFSDPAPTETGSTGTDVIISDIRGTFGSLLGEKASADLAKLFGVYLTQYPGIRLVFNGTDIRPESALRLHRQHAVEDFQIEIHEWDMTTKRAIQLCDSDGTMLEEVDVGQAVRAPGYHFTAKVCSDRFRDLEQENRLSLGELEPDIARAAEAARQQLNQHFRERKQQDTQASLDQWIAEGSHPFLELPPEAPQRRAFEQLATHLDQAGAGFRDQDTTGRMLTFHLLGSLLMYNPDGLNTIVDELFPMKTHDRNTLSALLG